MITWFYTNNMGSAQATTETYWSNWLSGGVTVAGLQASNLTFTAQLTSLASVDTVQGYQVGNRDRLVVEAPHG